MCIYIACNHQTGIGISAKFMVIPFVINNILAAISILLSLFIDCQGAKFQAALFVGEPYWKWEEFGIALLSIVMATISVW